MSSWQLQHTVELTKYDYDTKEVKNLGKVDLHTLVHCLSLENLAFILDSFCNSYDPGFPKGVKLGQMFQETHRTLQGVITNFCLGILVGLGQNVDLRFGCDPRNQKAIETCQKIAKLLENKELPIQPFI